MLNAVIIYGASGSGKSRQAEAHLNHNARCYWVERDNIRFNLMNLGDWTTYKPNQSTENIVDFFWKHMIAKAWEDNMDLVISDTLCKISDRRKLHKLLTFLGFSVSFVRMDTALEDCIEQDSKRKGFCVGAEIIKNQYKHLIENSEHI